MDDRGREIYVGEHRLYLAEDNILYFTAHGDYDENSAIAIKKASLKLANLVKGKVNVILDHNQVRKPSAKARMIVIKLTEYEKLDKIAHWGANPVARVVSSFIIEISNKKNMRFFKTEKKALEWLKGTDNGVLNEYNALKNGDVRLYLKEENDGHHIR